MNPRGRHGWSAEMEVGDYGAVSLADQFLRQVQESLTRPAVPAPGDNAALQQRSATGT